MSTELWDPLGYDDDLPPGLLDEVGRSLGFASADPDDTRGLSWRPIDLKPVIDGLGEPEPDILTRDDGRRLFYAGKLHALFGESESGKSWLGVVACAEEMNAGRNALYIDLEDSAKGHVSRLQALGVASGTILKRFHYAELHPPIIRGPGEAFRPTVLMARASEVLTKAGRPLTQRQVVDRCRGKRAADVRTALAALEDEGYVKVEPGPRGAQLHTLIRPFNEAET
jgi:hypothetical protein